MKGKTKDERLKELIKFLQPKIREMVLEIMEEKEREGGKDRPSFLGRSVKK